MLTKVPVHIDFILAVWLINCNKLQTNLKIAEIPHYFLNKKII